jgi:hypothetical protein
MSFLVIFLDGLEIIPAVPAVVITDRRMRAVTFYVFAVTLRTPQRNKYDSVTPVIFFRMLRLIFLKVIIIP